MGEGIFTCPFCGAPYGEFIPSGVVQVKCRYCGGIVPVTPRLEGLAKRCSNHPETMAMGLCLDCGESVCDRCLNIVEDRGKHLVCPSCLKRRRENHVLATRMIGVLSLLFGLIILLGSLSSSLSLYGIMLISLSFLAFFWPFPETYTIFEKRQAMLGTGAQSVEELYRKLVDRYEKVYGGGKELERIMNVYIKYGLNREDAIRKIAREEGV